MPTLKKNSSHLQLLVGFCCETSHNEKARFTLLVKIPKKIFFTLITLFTLLQNYSTGTDEVVTFATPAILSNF